MPAKNPIGGADSPPPGGNRVKQHIESRKKEFNKLTIFLHANSDAPYSVKKKVVDAAFSTSLLYGCEAWLVAKPREVEVMYRDAIKMLLGVRTSTKNDVALLEAGYPSLEATVRHRQKIFFTKMLTERAGMMNDPLMFAMKLSKETKAMSDYINSLLSAGDIIAEDISLRKELVRNATSTKSVSCVSINPDLSVHPMYINDIDVDDGLRIQCTRLRV